MIYFIPVIFFIIVLADAIINWYLIEKKDRVIRHWVEALIYSLVCVAVSSLLHFYFQVPVVPLIVFTLITRLTFFDPLLLLFRKSPLRYEGDPNKPDNEKSLYDRFEELFGVDIIWLRLIYLLMYIAYLIIYFN